MSLFFGGFVFLFLFVLRPFGLDLVSASQAMFYAGVFGAVCMGTVLLGTLLIPLAAPSFFSEERWTTGRQIFFVTLIIFLVGVANYICSALLNGGSWSWQQALWYQGITLAVGTPPLFVLTLVRQAQLLRKYQAQAFTLEQKLQEKLLWQQQDLHSISPAAPLAAKKERSGRSGEQEMANEEAGDTAAPVETAATDIPVAAAAPAIPVAPAAVPSPANPLASGITPEVATRTSSVITISGDYQNESLTVAVDKLYMVHAANNYIKVYFEEKGKVGYSILRLTLKRAEDLLADHSGFFRCHRTTIINLDKVLHVEGNAQGYKVKLAGIEESVPVSRSLGSEFTDRLLAFRKDQ